MSRTRVLIQENMKRMKRKIEEEKKKRDVIRGLKRRLAASVNPSTNLLFLVKRN